MSEEKLTPKKNNGMGLCKIVSTKIHKDLIPRLEHIAKTRFGVKSPYELMQLFIAVCFSFDNVKEGIQEESAERIEAAIEPFLEIEDKESYIASFQRSSGMKVKRQNGNIDTLIIIRDGGFIEVIEKDQSGSIKKSFSHDKAALLALTAGRPQFREIIETVMKGNKCGSFVECCRMLFKDSLQDALLAIRANNTSMGYSSIEYGNVPKQKRTRAKESNIIAKVRSENRTD